MWARRVILFFFLSFFLSGAAQADGHALRDRCLPLFQRISGEQAEIKTPIDQRLFSSIMLRNTNIIRCLAGLPILKNAPGFQPIALSHSNWMASTYTLSHTSSRPGWETLGDRLVKGPYKIKGGRENLALIPRMYVRSNERFRRVDDSSCTWVKVNGERVMPHSYASLAQYTLERLMGSPGHRENILSTDITHHTAATQISTLKDACGTHFVTQNFVMKSRRR